MPDERKHRGAHPADARLFSRELVPTIRGAVGDLSWLLSRGYPPEASLKIVGDRHGLRDRQRMAVRRAACSDENLARRTRARRPIEDLRGRSVAIDGFNLIITIEAALSGGVLVSCRDGAIRDLASVHGSYRSVDETEKAIETIGQTLAPFDIAGAAWFFDQPVSNSGRLAARVRELGAAKGWAWTAKVTFCPDRELAAADALVITADSTILDREVAWVPFVQHLLEKYFPDAWLLDLHPESIRRDRGNAPISWPCDSLIVK